jgi:hypothetical protein
VILRGEMLVFDTLQTLSQTDPKEGSTRDEQRFCSIELD